MKKLLAGFLFLLLCSCGRKPDVAWTFKTGNSIYSTPAISGENVVVSSTDGYVYALRQSDGALVWKQSILPHKVSTPLVRGKSIYVSGGKFDMFALDAKTGAVQWQFAGTGAAEYEPCADDTGLYYGTTSSYFYKLDYQGKKIWEFKTGLYLWATCRLYKDSVIFGAWDKSVYSLDRQTGSLRWKFYARKEVYGAPEIVNNRVYFATHWWLRSLDADTGKLVREVKTPYMDNVTFWNGFLWTVDDGLHKRNQDGDVVASWPHRTFSLFKAENVNGNFILCDGPELYGVSPEMKVKWKFTADDDFWLRGVAAGNLYFVGNRNGVLYALRLP